MTFNWYDYLLYAKEIAGEEINKDLTFAKYRSAISRAYYATYNITRLCLEKHCAIDFGSKKLYSIKKKYKKQDHGIIPILMKTTNVKDIMTSGTKLSNLLSKRVDADYKSKEIENIESKLRDTIENSEKIISSLELFKSGKASVNLNSLLK
ncbi:MAG: hypothetical protein J7K40_14535 [candidate division Zixibacteria bacterium]|nr:hypothetical protein [candidate division Zixibacteria bacterium]